METRSLSDMVTGESFDEQGDRGTDAGERLGRRIETIQREYARP